MPMESSLELTRLQSFCASIGEFSQGNSSRVACVAGLPARLTLGMPVHSSRANPQWGNKEGKEARAIALSRSCIARRDLVLSTRAVAIAHVGTSQSGLMH